MLSKNEQKSVRALAMKKYRDETKTFIAEGEKLVAELLPHFSCHMLLATDDCDLPAAAHAQRITAAEMKNISQLTTPTSVLAVFQKNSNELNMSDLRHELVLVLDTVQNPGNLGTIVRVADWFGVRHIICSPDCADVYSPKTVQATMGALAHVKVYYADLQDFFQKYQQLNLPVYGTLLNGADIYTQPLSNEGAIVMGSEGRGISPQVEQFVSQRLLIPNYPHGRVTTDSLNVAIATAVVCAEFRRRG